MKITLTLVSLFIIITSKGQIILPKGFVCTKKNTPSSCFLSDGRYTFNCYTWGHDGVEPKDLVQTVKINLDNKISFKRTSDGLYWGTGKTGNVYRYIVIVPNSLVEIQVYSSYNDDQFVNYSSWLLQEVRNNLKAKKALWFVDYNSKECKFY
jgi:hypothetical protein